MAVRSEYRYRHNHLDGKHHQHGCWEDEVEKNPRQEKEIIEGVASYGKQLGRISDALNVLIPLVISQVDRANLKQDERRALEDFSAMYREIATFKGKHTPPDEAQLDLLFEDIGELKGRDDETYQKLLMRLRDFAETKLRDLAEPEL